MKVICLHHRLGGYSSHHFNEARGFIDEFRRRGTGFVLLVNRYAEANVVAELHARAVLDDPTFRLEWSFEERSRRFVELLHRRVDHLVRVDDRLLLTIATQLEAHALTLWLQELPHRKKPWIVVLFVSDRWNRSGPEEHARQLPELRQLAEAIASLSPDDARRMIFCTLTDRLAEELTGLLDTKVAPAPMPLPYGESRPRHQSALPRVAILGGTRREKGSYLIPAIIEACRAHVPVEFLVHLINNSLTGDEAERLARIAEQPNVTVIREALPPEAYEAALDSADLCLFPYEAIPYRQRTSGVFGEAVAFGKPVVVTPGTWMAEQIETGRAAGTIAENLQPESIALAIARCVADLETLRSAAQAVSAAWRETASLPAFVDFFEAQIAQRSRDVQPQRRRFWPF